MALTLKRITEKPTEMRCREKTLDLNASRIFLWKPTKWEKFFNNSTSDRGMTSKTYEELQKQGIKKVNHSIKKWGTVLRRELSTEGFQMKEKHLNVQHALVGAHRSGLRAEAPAWGRARLSECG